MLSPTVSYMRELQTHAGWKLFVEWVEKEKEACIEGMVEHALSMEDIEHIRGSLAVLEKVKSFPERIIKDEELKAMKQEDPFEDMN